MPRTHAPYAPEYRRRIIELARAGRSINELAREFEPSANAIREWVKQAALDEGLRNDGLTTSEREELNRLRRENRVLREEREILSKAAAWFAQETGATPSRRSHSQELTRPCTESPPCAACWASPPAVIMRGGHDRLPSGRERMRN
jgi:transposase